MSVKVDLDVLAAQLGNHDFAYLMTVGEDQRAHAVAVRPVLDDGVLVVGDLGRRTRENLAARPAVSLVWPPAEPGGYSLIVDASASIDGEAARLAPEHAVLHRPAAPGAPPGATGCGNDCLPVEA